MGNLSTNIDYHINNYTDFSNITMIILTGGLSWKENYYNDIEKFIKNGTIR